MGLPACPSLVYPNSSWSSGAEAGGQLPKNVYSLRSHSGPALEGEGLSGRNTEQGHLRGAQKWEPGPGRTSLKEGLRSSYLTKPNLPDRVGGGLHLPRTNPQGAEEGKPGTRGPDMCLVGNGGGLLHTSEPQGSPCPLKAAWGGGWGVLRSRKENGRDNTVLACSLTYKK